jgi:hypothetical protein
VNKKRLILGISVIFLLGSGFHFTYELLGKSVLAAPFFPVNESVWEHMKLLSTAALVWMAVDFFLTDKVLRTRFFAARAAAMPLALLLMPMIYYFLKCAFGIENLFVDIANFLVVTAVYQYLAMRFEMCCSEISKFNIAGVVVLAIILLLYVVLTFVPPHLPIFQDPPTGKYGIIK